MDDVQSWWEIPCIAHFCSLFRLYFDLIDFDIEELEEALLTDSAEEVGNSFLQELIVRLLKGCFNTQKDEITTCNYQMYLRRLFRKKCEEGSTKNNPFDKDAAFYSLPLRTKVEILYDLCDFRLDNEDVTESLKSLESDSLRVVPLGQDSGGSTYWYFYGTRLYREDYCSVSTTASGKRKGKRGKEEKVTSSWQVSCFTEEDWQLLTRKFKNCKSPHEKNLHRTLRDDFLPELPRLFAEKERLQRKRMLEQQLRRSGRSIVSTQIATVAPVNELLKVEMPSMGVSKKSSSSQEDKGSKGSDSSLEDGDMEDTLKRQREEQEKADRLLAEEIEREERMSRLHLRERRGGGGASGSGLSSASSVTATHSKVSSSRPKSSSSQRKGSDSRSSSNNKSPSKTPTKKEKIKKKKKKSTSGGRTTNNSLAAALPSKDKLSDDGEKSVSQDGDAEVSRVKVKKKKRKDEDVRSRSRSPSQATSHSDSPTRKSKKSSSSSKSSSSPVKSKKKKTSSGHAVADDGEEGDGRSKEKSKDKKKHKIKKKDKSRDKSKGKEKEKSKPKEKGNLEEDHSSNIISVHSAGGMSKTKVKSSVIFSQSEEDVQIGMHKVIESIKNHGDAWPFLNPVDEDYAPNYYRVISCPMDLQTMEDKLDNHEYRSLDEFEADFQRIVENCKKYNGPSNEYTEMVETLQEAFNKAIQRFIVPDESDEEISIEYATAEVERKRPRKESHSAKSGSHKDKDKDKDESEHLKENAPSNSKKAAPLFKSKNHKIDKKKMKQKLMRHHSRNSETMENLAAVGAETLKDINKWFNSPPKQTTGPESESKKRKISNDESDTEVESKVSSPQVGHKRKAEEHSSSKSSSSKSKHKLVDDDDENSDEFRPPKKLFKKSSKHSKSESQSSSSSKKDGSHKSEIKSKKVSDKESKDRDKERHHYKHHKHRHSTDSTKRDSSSPKLNHKAHSSSQDKVSEKHEKSHHHKSEKLHKSVKEPNPEKTLLKHSKSLEEKKSKPPVKRGNSLFSSLKNGNGSGKRAPTGNKPPKFSAFITDSKFKAGSADGNKGVSGDYSQGASRDNGLVGEKPEKKKCLLLNDTPTDRDGGPRLSLGSVLSTDAIKLGEFKKEEPCSDDDYETSVSTNANKLKSEGENNGGEQKSKENDANKSSPGKTPKDGENEVEKEPEVEIDRKLEPSKGFNREKCMPNLSAWIKAFGGPAKPAGTPIIPIKKPDPETKTKFKVMGRGVGESSSNAGSHEQSLHTKPHLPKGSPIHKPTHKPLSEAPWNNINPNPQQNPLINPMKMAEPIPDDMSAHNLSHHPNKKHRNRKMSTSSLSSQSESGSPHCFSGHDGTSVIGGSVVNPPRWVDEHWTQSHSQSQSPSASSHVSSQSPANSPYSPAMNSPPHTPQTPPRPLGPVRAGFYQDITSQHSSPEKLNESHSNSNSNVASPSTPPTPTNNQSNSSRREVSSNSSSNAKANYYPPPVYVPRYAASTPSPNVGPGSNMHSPSPGGMGSVDSPGNPNSPHSPNVNPVATPVAEYRNTFVSQHQSTSTSSTASVITSISHVTPPAHQQQPTAAHRATVLNAHTGHSSPSIAPYPPPTSHYGHPSAINPSESNHGSSQQPAQAHQPAMAHMNQVQAHSQMSHQQHYDRYPAHSLGHHPISSQAPSSSIPSSSVPTSYTQNMTAAHSQSQRPSTAQPSPYPSNPYASNPRSINIPPNIYNNPISSDPAMNRFYKPTVSGGELSLTASSSMSSGGSNDGTVPVSSHSRSRSSRSNASAIETELPRSASASLEGKFPHGELNGFQWPHNLASLSQIVNSIPNPMNAVGMANAYRQYDQAMAETMSKYQRQEATGYTNLSASAAANLSAAHSGKSSSSGSSNPPHPPAAHSHSSEKISEHNSDPPVVSSRRQSSKSSESKSRSSSKSGSQSIVPGSAFNFSSLAPADLALYPKDMTDAGSLYSNSPPGLAHRPDLYPVSSSSFHPSFPTTARTTAGGVATSPITPYQIPPFIGSHPSPYQPQSVPSQAFAHSQPPRGLTVDTYQQFFQSSPHVMGLLPPTGYPYPHGLGFNRPGGWI